MTIEVATSWDYEEPEPWSKKMIKIAGVVNGVALAASLLFTIHGSLSNDAWFQGEENKGAVALVVTLGLFAGYFGGKFCQSLESEDSPVGQYLPRWRS